jgi:hypothetical protein
MKQKKHFNAAKIPDEHVKGKNERHLKGNLRNK